VRDVLDLSGHAWFSFDDEAVLARASDDPIGFVEACRGRRRSTSSNVRGAGSSSR
jgi:hypothetical protein